MWWFYVIYSSADDDDYATLHERAEAGFGSRALLSMRQDSLLTT
jgi:hypothetical protein